MFYRFKWFTGRSSRDEVWQRALIARDALGMYTLVAATTLLYFAKHIVDVLLLGHPHVCQWWHLLHRRMNLISCRGSYFVAHALTQRLRSEQPAYLVAGETETRRYNY